jgi:diguanylate cyclase (GGDEF)-like protein
MILPVALAALLGGLLLLVLGRPRRSAPVTPRVDHDRQIFEHASRLESDNRHLRHLLAQLPELIKQLTGDPDKRCVAPLVMNFIDYLFDPHRMMILYYSERKRGLVLTRRKGFGADVELGTVLPVGRGRIGWVAEHQISMNAADFRVKRIAADQERHTIREFERELELCVPMVHDQTLWGVIAISGPGRRPPNDKQMLRMVADLASIALSTAALLRKAELNANSDALTGLFNKGYLLGQLDVEADKARRAGEPLSVFFFDFDHFKNYNDRNGHQAGDEALRRCGQLLSGSLRDDDIPARYGGEEFVVVLPATTKLGAYEAGEKIRSMIEEHEFPHGDSQPEGRVTISGGVATLPDDGSTVQDLLEVADRALYRAKREGRNRVLMGEPATELHPSRDPAGVV